MLIARTKHVHDGKDPYRKYTHPEDHGKQMSTTIQPYANNVPLQANTCLMAMPMTSSGM